MATQRRHSSDEREAAQRRPKEKPALQGPVGLPELGLPGLVQHAVTQPGRMTPSGVQRLQRAFGNRTVNRLVPRSPSSFPVHVSGTAPFGVVQRLIWRVLDPTETEEETSYKVTTKVAKTLLKKKYKGKSLRGSVITDVTELKDVGLTETLYILGHGSGTTLSEKEPDELAKDLDGNLPPKFAGKIKLVSCFSADPTQGFPTTTGSQVTYAELLSYRLEYDHNRTGLTVTGMDGVADVTSKGKIVVYKESDYDAWLDEIKQYKKLGFFKKLITKKPALKWKGGKQLGGRVRYKGGLKLPSKTGTTGTGAGVGATEWAV